MIDAFLRGFERGLEKQAADFDLAPKEKPGTSASAHPFRYALKSKAREAASAVASGAGKATKAVKRAVKPYAGAAGTAYKAVKWGIPLTALTAGLAGASALSGKAEP